MERIQQKKMFQQQQPKKKKFKQRLNSVREGNVTGIHSVSYTSDEDKISIRHEAFNRSSFAKGAVAAAEFMVNRKGIFTMKDLLKQ